MPDILEPKCFKFTVQNLPHPFNSIKIILKQKKKFNFFYVVPRKTSKFVKIFMTWDFGLLDPHPDLQKYANPWIRIQGAKYQPKTHRTNI